MQQKYIIILIGILVQGAKVKGSFRSKERKFHLWYFRSWERKYVGTKVPVTV